MLRRPLLLLLTLLTLLAAPSLAHGAGVQPNFDPASPSGSPFPSDHFSVRDGS